MSDCTTLGFVSTTFHRTPLPQKTHQNRMWLTGLRSKGVPAVSSSGEEDFELRILEQRGKNPLSAKERTDRRFPFQHKTV